MEKKVFRTRLARLGRRRLAVVMCAVIVAVVAVPVALSLSAQQAGPPHPLGEEQTSLLVSLGGPATTPLASDYATALKGLEEIDTDAAREVGSRNGIAFFVSPSTKGGDRFCAFAVRRAQEGVFSGFTCLPRKDVGGGLAVVQLQARPGGIETPRVYFGVVPDGFVSAESGGETVPVVENVYSFSRQDGQTLSTITFERSDGSRVAVRVAL